MTIMDGSSGELAAMVAPAGFTRDGFSSRIVSMMMPSEAPRDSFAVPHLALDGTGQITDTLRYEWVELPASSRVVCTAARSGGGCLWLVLRGVTVIDGTDRPPAANMDVVIEGERIVAINPTGSVRHPRHARLLDLPGRYVLPGLIDTQASTQQERSTPILGKLKRWLVRTYDQELPSSALAKACGYCLNQWDAPSAAAHHPPATHEVPARTHGKAGRLPWRTPARPPEAVRSVRACASTWRSIRRRRAGATMD
jgi:hypothetical protein